jgi:hypothetical protein
MLHACGGCMNCLVDWSQALMQRLTGLERDPETRLYWYQARRRWHRG